MGNRQVKRQLQHSTPQGFSQGRDLMLHELLVARSFLRMCCLWIPPEGCQVQVETWRQTIKIGWKGRENEKRRRRRVFLSKQSAYSKGPYEESTWLGIQWGCGMQSKMRGRWCGEGAWGVGNRGHERPLNAAEGLRPCSEGDEETVQGQDLHCSEVHLELKRLEESTRDISTEVVRSGPQ